MTGAERILAAVLNEAKAIQAERDYWEERALLAEAQVVEWRRLTMAGQATWVPVNRTDLLPRNRRGPI